MDLAHPLLLILLAPALIALAWSHSQSQHPMTDRRRAMLLAARSLAVALGIVALAGPAIERASDRESVIFVLDRSASQGDTGWERANGVARAMSESLDGSTAVGLVSAADEPTVHRTPRTGDLDSQNLADVSTDAPVSDLADAVRLATGLFPPGVARRVVIVGDGLQTRGDLGAIAREAALAGVVIDTVGVSGEARPDVRVVSLRPSRARLHEGAPLTLEAEVESSLAGTGRLRLFQNGIEVDARPITLAVGERKTVRFDRIVEQRNLYSYRVVADGFDIDQVPSNDEATTLVEARGKPVLLYIEGEPGEAHYLTGAMAKEGIRVVARPVSAMPRRLSDLAGYDGIIVSDLPAHELGESAMTLIHDYVEQLGGGFLMIGGRNSFGVGGYYRTPIEQILPVKMKAPDTEEKFATALAFVIDRSGSMSGQKIEICKSAAIATIELLSSKDHVGVVAFDSSAHWIVPMTRVGSSDVSGAIATLNAGGGTNIYPGMVAAREALAGVSAKVKHMIVLTDGQTSGSGYAELAATIRAEGVTISTVGVGGGADIALLQAIAAAGSGECYATQDASTLPRIFTQDAMTHMGRLVREEAFTPQQVERHVMLTGWPSDAAPALLGYVKTDRKATAQVPLVTDLGDPLLAQWRYGLGKVAAFTSDCKSRWAAMWIAGWPEGYGQFWAQVLREVAREPQGHLMDIQVTRGGDRVGRISVDLLSDAGSFTNDAEIEAEVYRSDARSVGSMFEPVSTVTLQQVAPGRYDGRFGIDDDGLYMVRARSAGRMATAGLIAQPDSETTSGQIDRALLRSVAESTGGTFMDDDATSLPVYDRAGRLSFIDLRPLLLAILVVVFLVDVMIRRWENVLAVRDLLMRRA